MYDFTRMQSGTTLCKNSFDGAAALSKIVEGALRTLKAIDFRLKAVKGMTRLRPD
jgi:hypothetical protein